MIQGHTTFVSVTQDYIRIIIAIILASGEQQVAGI